MTTFASKQSAKNSKPLYIRFLVPPPIPSVSLFKYCLHRRRRRVSLYFFFKKKIHIFLLSQQGERKKIAPPPSPTPIQPKSFYVCRGEREERERVKKKSPIQSNCPKYARNYQLLAAWKPETPSLLSFFFQYMYNT